MREWTPAQSTARSTMSLGHVFLQFFGRPFWIFEIYLKNLTGRREVLFHVVEASNPYHWRPEQLHHCAYAVHGVLVEVEPFAVHPMLRKLLMQPFFDKVVRIAANHFD